MRLIPKRQVRDIDRSRLQEPNLKQEERDLLDRGIALFNSSRFWEAHEVWEEVWRRRPEESRIFFQGIIQVAAAYHLLVEKPRVRGAALNLAKALTKLELFPSSFLGIDVDALREAIKKTQAFLSQSGLKESVTLPDELAPTLRKSGVHEG